MASDSSTEEPLLHWRRAQDTRVTQSTAGTLSRVTMDGVEGGAGRRAPRWPEAALVAPLALYSCGYRRSPLPPGAAEGQWPGKTQDGDSDSPAFHHCPFLAEHGPFLVFPLLPPEPSFGLGSEVPGEGCYGTEWHLVPYAPTWAQPLYLSPPLRRKVVSSPFDGTVGSDEDLSPPNDAVLPLPAEDRAPSPWLGRALAGTTRQDGDAAPSPTGPPFLLLPPGAPAGPWAGAWPCAERSPLEPAPESLAHPCPAAASPPAPGQPSLRPCPQPWAEEPSGCARAPRGPAPATGPPPKLKQTWLTRHSAQSSPCRKAPAESKRAAKRPPGTGDAPGAAKRAAEPAGTPEQPEVPPEASTEPGEGAAGLQERWQLQTVPCTALPTSVPRCCACAARTGTGDSAHEDHEDDEDDEDNEDDEDDDDDDDDDEGACRLRHFRRLVPGPGGELRAGGLCSLEAAPGQPPPAGTTTCPEGALPCAAAQYLLAVLGDDFCEAVRRDRAAWRGAAPQPGPACRRGHGVPRLCDGCRRGLFNLHWSCARCGFQLCPACHGHARPQRGPAAASAACAPGQQHDADSLVPTQFVPTRELDELWTLLHEVRARAGIPARCPCAVGDTGSAQEELELLPVNPSGAGEATTSQPVEEASPASAPGTPPAPARGTGLRALLASTAVRLCPARGAPRMPFAPVAPAPPAQDSRLASLLEGVIARVVERRVQERHAAPPGQAPPTSHRLLAPGGPLWLLQPEPPRGYGLFQRHWRQGQPVLVSGLQERLDGRLWALRPPGGGGCRLRAGDAATSPTRAPVPSERCCDGVARRAACAEPRGDGEPASSPGAARRCRRAPWPGAPRAAELHACLPLREYCGPRGRLNLAARLRRARRPRPRLRLAAASRHGGTRALAAEAADWVSVLLHAEAAPRDRPGLLLRAEEAGVGAALRERLAEPRSRPGALWHVFRAEDAGRIRDFLQRVGAGGATHPGQDAATAPPEPGPCYLDGRLRQRLRDECGVSAWALLQFVGDAVLVPAGAPHQVQALTDTVSVEQRFLSPENAARLREPSAGATGAARHLRGQVDAVIFSAVREAVGILRGCE